MFVEDEWAPLIRAIDERLRPIANRPVDISDPNWVTKARRSSPLDEAGVRAAAQELLQKLVHAYATGDDEARASIRALFRRFSSFAWAATLPSPMTTTAGFRDHLLHFAILDQGPDPRDATLWIDRLVATARAAGVDVEPALREIAALSNREDRLAWGSTAEWLLRRAGSR